MSSWMFCAGPAAAMGFAPPPAAPAPEPEDARRGMRVDPAAPAENAAPLRPAPAESLALSCLRQGREAAAHGRLDDALAWFDRALVLDADLGIAHFCRAMVLADLDRADEASEALERSMGRSPDDFAARIQFARLLARHGHYTQALRVLSPALTAKPHLREQIHQDRDFQALRDHPYFLQMVGAV